jgi:hypothetical protein
MGTLMQQRTISSAALFTQNRIALAELCVLVVNKKFTFFRVKKEGFGTVLQYI